MTGIDGLMSQGASLFWPHIVGGLHFVAVFSAVIFSCRFIFKTSVHGKTALLLGIIVGTVATLFFLQVSLDRLLTPSGSKNQEKAELAIILGFGLEQDNNEKMLPGQANVELLEWLLERIDRGKFSVKTILVQEGVWLATADLERKGVIRHVTVLDENTRQIFTSHNISCIMARIHKHLPDLYSNTFNTLYLAAARIDQSNPQSRTVLLVAHDLQLQRAVIAWQRAAQQFPQEFQRLSLAIPSLGKAFPGVTHSVHPWTRSRLIYKFSELLIRMQERYELLPETEMARVVLTDQKQV